MTTIARAIFLILAFTGISPAKAWEPCHWTLDGSFTATLFLRLKTMRNPSSVSSDYLTSTRFQLKSRGEAGAEIVLRDPQGKNMGFISITRETLNDAAGTGDLPGYSFDVYVKDAHRSSGLGTMLFLVTALHLEKQGFKLRAPVSFSENAAKSFDRLRAAGLLKKVAAREDDGDAVQIFEFDLSGLSVQDRADLSEIRLLGPEAEAPALGLSL